MISLSTVFCILIIVALALSLVSYGRMPLPGGRKAVLLCLRCAGLGLLLLFFFQPVLHLTRLTPDSASATAVLIDASASMRLFEADSLLQRLRTGLEKLKAPSPAYFLFGDSLRAGTGTVTFSDRRSSFPGSLDRPGLATTGDVILFSDGNWTNAALPRESFENRTIHYVTMRKSINHPFLALEAAALPREVVAGAPAAISVALTGYRSQAGPIRIDCSLRGNVIRQRTVTVDSGHFADTVTIAVPSEAAGSNLYQVTARGITDSLQSVTYALQQVVRQKLRVAIAAARPSLDQRFMRLAVIDKGWELTNASRGDADILLIFDWDRASQALLDQLPSRATAVFVGTAPAADGRLEVPLQFSPKLGEAHYHAEQIALVEQLPPPSHILRLPRLPWRQGATLLSATVTTREHDKPEQLPFVYEAFYRKRNVLVVAARGLWRWDFWPVALHQQEAGGSFADFLLAEIEQLARSNANQSLYVYPDRSPCREGDSLVLRFVLPQPLATDTVGLRLTLCAAATDTVLDTTFLRLPYAALDFRAALAPIAAGAYRFSCTAGSSAHTARYADSLRVVPDDAELRVREQNRLLLDQFALPLDLGDSGALASYFHARTAHPAASATETRTIPLRQSWPLLLSLIALLCAEWFLRKLWRVE